jgi:hypothetical protein
MRAAVLYAGVLAVLVVVGPADLQSQSTPEGLHRGYDELLDLYVRDGLVYYGALKSDRRRLDAYVASLEGPRVQGLDRWGTDEQIAFWLNAYNALVLRAVIDHYPIRGTAAAFPPNSVRQVPGVFDRQTNKIAGRSLTLDQIETTVLAGFHDPRLFLALGRGALGSGRLRSEAYAGSSLGGALQKVAQEFATGGNLLEINETNGEVSVTPIVSWRDKDFVAAYAAAAEPRYNQRSPLEKALLAFVQPHLLPHERLFLERNEFRVQFQTFDWRLNDLSGGRP